MALVPAPTLRMWRPVLQVYRSCGRWGRLGRCCDRIRYL